MAFASPRCSTAPADQPHPPDIANHVWFASDQTGEIAGWGLSCSPAWSAMSLRARRGSLAAACEVGAREDEGSASELDGLDVVFAEEDA